ncbi:hypothetical protein [Actinomadura gamaensis]|uniref:Excreted virulence factor EspC, type VII ESX diderm n=1 Tax=Actinomadura gamaensis TaxID=1763541 RepID=A0ABV9U685_9ACTN
MTETGHDVTKLVSAAESVDRLNDRAQAIKSAAQAINVTGHEWGLVGMVFSVHYDSASKDINEHLDLMVKSLTGIESGIEQTARNYAGANQAILAKINALEKDAVEMGPAPSKPGEKG